MIDQYIKQATQGSQNVAGNVKTQVEQPQKISKGVEGFKKEQGVNLKKGGFIAKGCGKVMNNRRKKTRMY